jgi:phosphopantothenoylcysteine decarboxylase/phosphopantothenate--cysteine ligase
LLSGVTQALLGTAVGLALDAGAAPAVVARATEGSGTATAFALMVGAFVVLAGGVGVVVAVPSAFGVFALAGRGFAVGATAALGVGYATGPLSLAVPEGRATVAVVLVVYRAGPRLASVSGAATGAVSATPTTMTPRKTTSPQTTPGATLQERPVGAPWSGSGAVGLPSDSAGPPPKRPLDRQLNCPDGCQRHPLSCRGAGGNRPAGRRSCLLNRCTSNVVAMLDGVNVALGVTGSIAAVKTVELAHELRRRGAAVRAVMTDAARGIVHPWALEFATDAPVVTETTGAVEHVELCGREGWADVLLVAPATANTVGKMAAAVDDTPVTTCATTTLGADVPVVVAPAMHEPMYDHPGVLDAIERVESWGVDFVDPRVEEGKAKIATEDAIALATARAATADPLAGRHVVVTSGATTESIDPVRTLSNRASGKTGRAVARACYVRGADVTLVHDGDEKPYAAVESVESGAEMQTATLAAVDGADALVSAAAISDYTVDRADRKIRSGQGSLTLELEPTPKVVDAVREAHPDLPVVGFKAETGGDDDDLVAAARDLRERVGMAFVVANDASVMAAGGTRALLVEADGVEEYEGPKVGLGARVAEKLAAHL